MATIVDVMTIQEIMDELMFMAEWSEMSPYCIGLIRKLNSLLKTDRVEAYLWNEMKNAYFSESAGERFYTMQKLNEYMRQKYETSDLARGETTRRATKGSSPQG